MNKKLLLCASIFALATSNVAFADSKGKGEDRSEKACPVSHAALENAIKAAQAQANGGLGLNMWATVVNANGIVCAVAKSGNGLNSQWLGSRVISAQKAYTANAFSLNHGLALSTANLYSAVQPGGSLYGLQFSNPVDTNWAYAGNSKKFGRKDDPMTGRRIGGVNVFGGGLALYDATGKMVGAVGVSGDTSCADHNIAWRVRDTLKLDYVPAGVGAPGDNIIWDESSVAADGSANNGKLDGFEHATCSTAQQNIDANIAVINVAPLGPNPANP